MRSGDTADARPFESFCWAMSNPQSVTRAWSSRLRRPLASVRVEPFVSCWGFGRSIEVASTSVPKRTELRATAARPTEILRKIATFCCETRFQKWLSASGKCSGSLHRLRTRIQNCHSVTSLPSRRRAFLFARNPSMSSPASVVSTRSATGCARTSLGAAAHHCAK